MGGFPAEGVNLPDAVLVQTDIADEAGPSGNASFTLAGIPQSLPRNLAMLDRAHALESDDQVVPDVMWGRGARMVEIGLCGRE